MNNNEKKKKKKDTYDKLMGYGQGDLFSESGFDEMQLAKKYKIGFKLFRALFWVQYAAAMAVTFIAASLENNTFVYIGAGLLSIGTVFYIIYSYKIASEELMNAKFASSWNHIIYPIVVIFLMLVWLLKLIRNKTDFFSFHVWLNLGVMYLGNYLCARKNMKVLEKMLSEDSENEE